MDTEWLYDFPFKLPINLEAIDDAVLSLSIKFEGFFALIKTLLGDLVNFINSILNYIPWFILVILVVIVAWRISGKINKGILYGAMLVLIGALGLWSLMYETLSIILASVIISLIFGFPIGILLSTSDRLDRLVRPILDTMQTMPVFVYLIPAMMFLAWVNRQQSLLLRYMQ